MDRTTLRGVAFWATVVTALLELLRAIYAIVPLTTVTGEIRNLYGILSIVGFFIAVLSAGSMLLFLGLVHYDLSTTQRLSEHARDYLIRDLTQTPQEKNPNHG